MNGQNKYERYIEQLKKFRSGIDYERIYSRIEEKAQRSRPFIVPKFSLAAAGALALLIVGSMVYYNTLSVRSYVTEDNVPGYVFEDNGVNGNPVMAYVFSE
jgi:hypothetical protein